MYATLIQEALTNSGYDPGPVDGIAGPRTISAIKAFQSDRRLNPDGMVGPLTHDALFSSQPKAITSPTATVEPKQLTPHFHQNEFRCCCEGRYCDGFPAEMNSALISALEEIRNFFNLPLIITSGLRCQTRNREVGGIPYSKHLVGNAADCYISGISVFSLADAARQAGLGVIVYQDDGFCHLEI
ncbi:MAG: D-Ala-D-Ala carboxypeptidase family metallohydrolase [Acetobacterium sp.]|nr:D-Ala-D-Ala carboxypeptidase family metallohydrolase [Acetobacterium sp.]